jgi:acetyl esterase/lipase
MTSHTIVARVDRELEPFISMFPRAELNDPVTARKKLAELSAKAPAPDIHGMEICDLPPAYIATAEFDPNRDEAIVYAQRLMEAGVPVERHQWRGTFHGSQAVLSADVSQRQIAELGTVLHHALAG